MKRQLVVVALGLALLGAGAASAADPPHDGNTPTRPLTPLGKMLADSMQPAATPSPDDPTRDRAAPKNEPPGTLKTYHFWYGPYTIQPGSDAQHVDLGLPLDSGFMITVEPRLRNMDMSTPSMLTGHIHHAHWFVANSSGLEWIFGNGDEGTRASFAVMNEFDPDVQYGQFIGKDDKQLMVYMLHNRTSKTQKWWVDLEVQFLFGTEAQLNTPALKAKRGGKEFRDVKSVLNGATFDVPRQANGDGSWNTNEATSLKGAGLTTDLKPGDGPLDKLGIERLGSMGFGMPAKTNYPQEWIAPADGTLMEIGTHMHPGSTHALIENMGSPSNPCPDDGKGTGGTLLLRADAINMHVPFSDDYQIEISQPGWRVPVRKGDHIRYTAFYENKDHAWSAAMDVTGIGVDYRRKPAAGVRCTVNRVGPPLRVKDIRDIPGRGVVAPDYTANGVPSVMSFEGGWPADTPEGRAYAARKAAAARKATTRAAKKKTKKARRKKAKVKDVGNLIIPITDGLPNRAWHHGVSPYCGDDYGARACERPVAKKPPGIATTLVTIANFLYRPGDMSLPGVEGAPPRIRKGQRLQFLNLDGGLLIRHSVTTCAWPCNGPYVTNYPAPDGVWESGTFGIDPLGDGMLLQQAQTPKDLDVGKYAYFCRIHPWMRGAFEVVS
jgi:hypothetical protein